MPKLEDLELKVKQTTADTKGLKALASALKDLAESANKMGNVGDGMRKLSDALRHFPVESANSVKGFATAFVQLKNVSQYSSTIASSVRQVSRALNEMTASLNTDKLTAIANAMEKIKDASKSMRVKTAIQKAAEGGATSLGDETAATDTSAVSEVGDAAAESTSKVERFKAALKSLGTDAVQATKTGLKHLWLNIKGLAGVAIDAGKGLLKMGKNAASSLWDTAKNKLKSFTGAISNLVNSFARIAMYRALRTAIKAITTGFSEGIKHLYHWSKLVDNNFKQSMDSLSTSAHYLRDSLGAMASPLIDALAPAVEMLVERFVTLLNTVNQFIATFTGQNTWRKAVRTATEYDDGIKDATESTKKATKAQKELNKALQGFDELNVITTSEIKGKNPTPTTTGKDSGIDSTHFVEEPIADWIQEIKDAIEGGDWYGAGQLLGDKLNELIHGWNAEEWGNKLGEKFQNAISFYLGFMKRTDWGGLGTQVATAINGALQKISAEDLGDAITAKLEAAVKFLKNFSAEIKLDKLGEALGVAFNNIFSDEFQSDLGETIGNFINDGIDFAAAWISTADLGEAGRNIMDGIFTAITTIDWGTMGEVLADVATGILDGLFEAIEYACENIDDIIGAIIDFVDAFFSKLGEWFYEKFLWWTEDVNTWFEEVFGTEGAKGSSVADSLVGDFETPTSKAKELNDELDKLDGRTSTFSTKDKNNSMTTNDKKAEKLGKDLKKTSGTFKAKFTQNGIEKSTNYVKKYLEKLTSVRGTHKAIIKLVDADTSYKEVRDLAKLLEGTFNGKKYKATIDIEGGGTSQAKVVINNYMGTGLTAYAEGGYPSEGSLFLAGEQGPEFVSNINGKTGVASGQEVTGIADAVYNTGETEASLLREQNRLLRQLLAKGFNVTLAPNSAAGKWISQAQTAYARATGG